MSGTMRVLKTDLKLMGRIFAGVLLGAVIGLSFLSLFLGSTVMADISGSFSNAVSIFAIIMLVIALVFSIAFGHAQSMGDTFPIANKVGNDRKDIALGFIIKDAIVLIVSMLFLHLILRYAISFINNNPNLDFGKLNELLGLFMTPKYVVSFILNITSISIIATVIAYMFKINPIVGCIFGIIICLLLASNPVILVKLAENIIINIILFIIAQVFRYFVITKADARF